jgi:hypothetical protein
MASANREHRGDPLFRAGFCRGVCALQLLLATALAHATNRAGDISSARAERMTSSPRGACRFTTWRSLADAPNLRMAPSRGANLSMSTRGEWLE